MNLLRYLIKDTQELKQLFINCKSIPSNQIEGRYTIELNQITNPLKEKIY